MNSSNPPIIILQGDHGPAFYTTSKIETTCLSERTSILNAYYLPNLHINPLYEHITPVNSFRVIFNAYFSTHFELQDDLIFYNGNSKGFTFTDITKESKQTCQLP